MSPYSHSYTRSSTPGLFVVLVQASWLLSTSTVLSCDPLIYRADIRVECVHPITKAVLDCHSYSHDRGRDRDRAKPIPVGTVAKYSCDTPIYLPSNSELTDSDRTLTCSPRGKWVGGIARFHSYPCTLNCGATDAGALNSFVIGGITTKQSDWPWHATIFTRPRASANTAATYEFNYMCGGSLIKPLVSKEFLVVTAAHCVSTAFNRARDANDVLVTLGSEESSLEGFAEHSPHGKVYKVKEIVVHKSYGGQSGGFQADIALVRLSEPVTIRPHILPVCLSKASALPSVGEVGHVVGFGLYEKEYGAASIQLRRASFPVVSPDKCFEWRTRKLLSQEYCAGTDNLQNACNGDSGGGMVFNGTDHDHTGVKRFYLQGLVSHGRLKQQGESAGEGCDTYSVYTKVSGYVDWIYATAEQLFEDCPTSCACASGESLRNQLALYRPGTGTIWVLQNERKDGALSKFRAVYQEGVPGAGIGGYDLKSHADRIFTFDYEKTGIQDHLVLIRPGTGTLWILKNVKGSYVPVYQEGDPGRGIGGYDLRSGEDQGFAFDYESSGRQDHIVLYRPGTGTIWILKHEDGGGDDQFVPVYKEGDPGRGIGGYDLRSLADRVFGFDFDHSGKADHLVLYRPGTGKIVILKNNAGQFTAVYEQKGNVNGIGGYDLKSPHDRMFAFDYESTGKLDHLALYRPGRGGIWILRNNGGFFEPVYREGDPGNGIGGYDLRSTADRAFAYDYDGSGRQDHLVLYRPGTGTLWILKNDGAGKFKAVYKEGDPGNGIGGYDLKSQADRAFAYSYCSY